jgi:ABC-type transport system involved in multi-copper enzyme maturation permease subunit
VHDTALSSSTFRSDGATPIVTGDSHAGFGSLIRSEWTKLRSVRSTIWALVLLVVTTVGFTILLSWLAISQWDTFTPMQQQEVMADPAGQILGSGFQFSQLAVCVLGVLVMTAEYSSGTIRASLLAVPRRTPMLAAKALVFAAVVFVVAEIAAFPSFFIGAAIMRSRAPVSIGDPDVLRAVIGAGLYASVLGVFAIAIGTLVRHTAGAITGIIGFVLVLSPLALLLPGTVGQHIHAYLPTVAGQGIAMTAQRSDDLLTAWQGFGVFGLWTAALLALGAYLLKRRDA